MCRHRCPEYGGREQFKTYPQARAGQGVKSLAGDLEEGLHGAGIPSSGEKPPVHELRLGRYAQVTGAYVTT